MIAMILTGHGNFASGLKSSMKLIGGEPENFAAVDFLESYSTDDLEKEINKALETLDTKDGVIIFSDLAGGSPFKTSVEISMKRKENIKVIAGTNLGMLIEIGMSRSFIEDIEVLTDMAVNTGKDQVMKYEFKKRVEEEVEDGI